MIKLIQTYIPNIFDCVHVGYDILPPKEYIISDIHWIFAFTIKNSDTHLKLLQNALRARLGYLLPTSMLFDIITTLINMREC